MTVLGESAHQRHVRVTLWPGRIHHVRDHAACSCVRTDGRVRVGIGV